MLGIELVVSALESLGNLDGTLDVGDETDVEVNSGTAHDVTSGNLVLAGGVLADVDDHSDIALSDLLEGGGSTGLGAVSLIILIDGLLHDADFNTLGLEEGGGTRGTKKLVTKVLEDLGTAPELITECVAGNRKKGVLVFGGELELGRDHGLHEGLVLGIAEASDLPGRGHLYAKVGIGTAETSKGEHGSLDADVVNVKKGDAVGLDLETAHRLGGKRDEVVVEGLTDEREGSACSEVALNDLDVVVLGHELDVEGTGDLKGAGDHAGISLDLSNSVGHELLGGEDDGSVTTVDTGVLQMLADGVVEDGTLVGNGIELNLLGAKDELGNDDGLVSGNISSEAKEVAKLVLVCGDAHGSTGQDETGADKDRESDLVGELNGLILGLEDGPGRLVEAHAVKHVRELTTILSTLNVPGGGAEDVGAEVIERSSEVVGDLSTDGNDDAGGSFPLVDIEDTLKGELLEVKAVTLVVIGTDSLGVVVDDDGLEAIPTELAGGGHGAPIELNTGANAVGTATEDHHTTLLGILDSLGSHRLALLESDDGGSARRNTSDTGVVGHGRWKVARMGRFRNIIGVTRVGHVKVVGLSRELGGESINLLDNGKDAVSLTQVTDLGLSPLTFGGIAVASDLTITETSDLEGTEALGSILADEVVEVVLVLASLSHGRNVLELAEEPLVDLGELVDLINAPAILKSGLDSEETGIGGRLELLLERDLTLINDETRIATLETIKGGVDHTACLLDHLLEGAADGHDLTDTEHR